MELQRTVEKKEHIWLKAKASSACNRVLFVAGQRLTNMGVLILCIILIFSSFMIAAIPVLNSIDEASSEHLSGLQEYQIIQSFLANYVETRFPNLNVEEQSRMRAILVNRFRMKIVSEHLTWPWYGDDGTFARMLK